MGLQHAYAVTNLCAGLADSAFTWLDGSTTNRSFLHDGVMSQVFSATSRSSGNYVIVDLGAALPVNAIALLNSNIVSALNPGIYIKSADDAAITINVINNKLTTTPNGQWPRDREHILQFAPASKRYWQINWQWTGVFTLTLGEIFMASTIQPQRYTVYGWSEQPKILRTVFSGYTGETRASQRGGPLRYLKLPFQDLSEAERNDFLNIMKAAAGGTLPMLWCRQFDNGSVAASNDQQDCVLGRLMQPSDAWGWTEFDFQRFNMDAMELQSLARDVGH